ncbi:Ubiquitin-- ligase [Olea europaea subsp. europaea]|uniref:RING-type E3 ubiquitin transferase n=2 Tax=Olea europaea subsp. europaea TaxID=158383 RepID=A0A8S0QS49_OLEEU|nr:Ubiquitin-- ligase [Olea europaea subsp. europaea]
MDYQSNKVIYVDMTKRGEEEVACQNPLMYSSIQIMYDFSWQTTLRYTKFEYGEQVQTEIQQEKIWDFVYLEPQQFLSYRKMHEIVNDALGAWPICNGVRKSLIKEVFLSTQAMAESMSSGHYALHIDVDVNAVYHYTIGESQTLNRVLQHSIEENSDYNMIPASQSSIKSLKRKKLDDENNNCDSCTICLDQFSKRSKITYMPCSHMFHGNCIKKWLRTSHHCPVCRFEMPTS